VRRGMISAPPFLPPGGMRFPGSPPMMPPMPVNMPQPPQAPQQPPQGQGQQAGHGQGAPLQQGQPVQQAAPQFPQGQAWPQQQAWPQALPQPQAFQKDQPEQGAWNQPVAPIQAQGPQPQFDPNAQQMLWLQQQAFAQQQAAQQALQQQALAQMMPFLLPQLQGQPGFAQPRPVSPQTQPAPLPGGGAAPSGASVPRRTARTGTYSTKGNGGGYSTRG
jgi:hypothetical protein